MRTLEHQMLNIWRLTIALRNRYGCGCRYVAPNRLHLSSTPLNEALIALHEILPNFQRENKLQKVQCVVLTDGEANCLPYHIEVKRGSEPYIGVRGISPNQTFRALSYKIIMILSFTVFKSSHNPMSGVPNPLATTKTRKTSKSRG
jgi:hypothetical protein